MPDHFVYILECSDKTFYVGYTTDPTFRLEYHQACRGSTYTACRLPVALVFHETYPTMETALAREKQLKRWSHAKKAALISGNMTMLHDLSRRRRRHFR